MTDIYDDAIRCMHEDIFRDSGTKEELRHSFLYGAYRFQLSQIMRSQNALQDFRERIREKINIPGPFGGFDNRETKLIFDYICKYEDIKKEIMRKLIGSSKSASIIRHCFANHLCGIFPIEDNPRENLFYDLFFIAFDNTNWGQIADAMMKSHVEELENEDKA